uniref:Uncharacterized protein n=1 Tax=Manihot esculenta TaxID=3983 RepID=A0A251KQL1_MANES
MLIVCLAPCMPSAKLIRKSVASADGMRGAMHATTHLFQEGNVSMVELN